MPGPARWAPMYLPAASAFTRPLPAPRPPPSGARRQLAPCMPRTPAPCQALPPLPRCLAAPGSPAGPVLHTGQRPSTWVAWVAGRRGGSCHHAPRGSGALACSTACAVLHSTRFHCGCRPIQTDAAELQVRGEQTRWGQARGKLKWAPAPGRRRAHADVSFCTTTLKKPLTSGCSLTAADGREGAGRAGGGVVSGRRTGGRVGSAGAAAVGVLAWRAGPVCKPPPAASPCGTPALPPPPGGAACRSLYCGASAVVPSPTAQQQPMLPPLRPARAGGAPEAS